eukprot:TRINITY_DN21735_c0_g1_i1.p2 TRINITY_DN21735_c0_g1~~TRINITY_DN21735_c0_g1_i1.p2  ORF type:complete len:193 (+),score=17.41 TRINITY_DN21735_c0_g1_i1:122-700(+)
MLKRVVRPGHGSARQKQDQRVDQRQVEGIKGLHPRRRPAFPAREVRADGRAIEARTSAHFMEERGFKEHPEPRHEEHDFRDDEQDHAVAQTKIHDRRVVALARFLDHIAPPADHRPQDNSQTQQENREGAFLQEEVGPALFVSGQTLHLDDGTKGHDEGTQRAGEGPRARINEVIIVFDGTRHERLLHVYSV